MPFDIGINFRGTLAYVTDGLNEVACYTYAVTYPQTRGGATFGWLENNQNYLRDRDASVDRRLAGCHFNYLGSPNNPFRLDLPAPGSYLVHLALGSASTSNPITCDLLDADAATVLKSFGTGASIPAGSFLDATGAVYTAATWPGSEQPTLVTVAGTSLYLRLNNKDTPLAHLRVVSAAPAASGWCGLAGLCKPGAGVAHILGG